MEPSANVEDWVREEIDKLESYYGKIMGCRVALEIPHRHRAKGKHYHIRIRLTVPGREIVVKWEPTLGKEARHLRVPELTKRWEVNPRHKKLRQALNDAFKAAGRRLEDYARRHRGDVKTHALLPIGRVNRLFKEEGYGFLTTIDGRELYFHKDSVLNRGFPRLRIGTPVSFAEEEGEKGPQASTVRIHRRHGAAKPVVELTASAD
jgi:cold shock CspA family protein